MATTFTFRVNCEERLVALAERALTEALQNVARLERELSEFLSESPIDRLNHTPCFQWVDLTPDGIALLDLSEKMRVLTTGAFDCTAKSNLQLPMTEKLEWRRDPGQARRLHPKTRVGFGAIGKGYALDQARGILERLGFTNYSLSAGGSSLVFSGFAGPSEPWTWGWSWKKDPSGDDLGIPFAHHSGSPIAVGVSGTHEKGNHILAPLKGRATSTLQSALVAHPSAAMADALSTSLFVSGWESSLTHFEGLMHPPAVATIDHLEIPKWNGVFQKLWGACASLICTAGIFLISPSLFANEEVDLGAMGLDSFTPYVFDRNKLWGLLPILAILLVLLHLKSNRRNSMKKKSTLTSLVLGILLWSSIETASAVQVEPLGKALGKILGATKGVKKKTNTQGKFEQDIYYVAGGAGPSSVAVVEHGIYPPDCTHTWAVGLDPKTSKVKTVRVIEMSCPHAFPTKASSFLDQYIGMGPAQMKSLKSKISTIAKATGSCDLTTAAVQRSISGYQKMKTQLK